MPDLRARFRTLDAATPPYLWAEVVARAEVARPRSAGLSGRADRMPALGLAGLVALVATMIAAVALGGMGGSEVASPSPSSLTRTTPLPVSVAWHEVDEMADARIYHAAVLLPTGKVLVMGGAAWQGPGRSRPSDSSTLATAELFDPVSESWSATGSMLQARSAFAAVLLADGTVLVAGGFGGPWDDPGAALDSAETYDPSTGIWTATGPLPAPTGEEEMLLLPDGRVWASSGAFYDSGTRTWTEAPALGGAVAVLADGSIIGVGGGDRSTAVFRFDPVTGAVTREPSLPEAFGGHVTVLLRDGRLLVAGGDAPTGPGARAWAHVALRDPVSGAWELAAPLDDPRLVPAAAVLADGSVLVCGGEDYGSLLSPVLDSCERFDPTTSSWSADASLAVARGHTTLTLLSDGRVLAVGGFSGGAGSTSLASTEIRTPGP